MMNRTVLLAALTAAAVAHGQGQGGGRGGPQGAPPAGVGRGAAPPLGATPKPAIANAKPVRSCESLATVALPNTTIESAAVDPENPGICRVTAITTHPPAGDKIRIWVAIPTSNWNGRFLGIGGGGFSGGSAAGVNQPVALGYASGSTDTGHEGGSGSFALDANGRLNWQVDPGQRARGDSRDDGHRQGTDAGNVRGRAALFLFQRLLDRRAAGTDGGAAVSAGLQRHRIGSARHQLDRFIPQELWGAVLMNAAGNPLPLCKLAAATAAAIAACDAIDGVKDGVIEDPKRCNYDPKALIGTSAGDCGRFHRGRCKPDPKVLGRPAPRRTEASSGTAWRAERT